MVPPAASLFSVPTVSAPASSTEAPPVTASVAILTGINIWNDYSFQLYVLQKPKLRTITLMLRSFFAEGNTNLNAAAAAIAIAIMPVIIVYLFLSKYFVQGVVDSAVK